MKKLTLLFLVIFMSSAAFPQQQFENPGFEDWEDAGTVLDEPTNWSSIKTSDGGVNINNAAPIVWEQSTDSHSGNYCVRLFNTLVFSIIANGTLTNGQVHASFNPELGYVFTNASDEQWHTPFTDRPDSLVFWYKAFPLGNDFGKVRCILHTDEGSMPENGTQDNFVAEAIYYFPEQQVSEWTRVSVPFTYFKTINPEYILCILNSGNGTEAVEESEAYFDDLELIYNPEAVSENILEGVSVIATGTTVIVKIDNPADLPGLNLEIFDLTGRSLINQQVAPAREIVYPVNLKPGLYICRIKAGNGIYTAKLYMQ